MSDQIDLVLKSIEAAKQANLASVKALEAVEQMLKAAEPELALGEGSSECTHETASLINTSAGTFQVCHCGWQIQL